MRGWFPVTLAAMERRRVSSGSPFEPQVGFSRAVRVGQRVLVSGTAPVWPDGSCDPDPANQARRCLAIILAALTELSVRVRLTSSGRARTHRPRRLGGDRARPRGGLRRDPFGEHDGLCRWLARSALEGGDRGGGDPRRCRRPAGRHTPIGDVGRRSAWKPEVRSASPPYDHVVGLGWDTLGRGGRGIEQGRGRPTGVCRRPSHNRVMARRSDHGRQGPASGMSTTIERRTAHARAHRLRRV